MISKIKTIIFSRLKNQNKEAFIKARRKICATCEFNTKNIDDLRFSIKVVKFFSDFYSFITGNKKVDTLGNCTACEICSIYYKTVEKVEQCPAKPAKWNRIK